VWTRVRPSADTCGRTLASASAFIIIGGMATHKIMNGHQHQQTWTTQCLSLPTRQKKSTSVPIEQIYEVGEILGEGAYGKVYKAKRRKDGKVVALKAINQILTDKEGFEREIKALSTLSENGGHESVCCMYDMHNDGKVFYLAMELIEGCVYQLYDFSPYVSKFLQRLNVFECYVRTMPEENSLTT